MILMQFINGIYLLDITVKVEKHFIAVVVYIIIS